eukprot:GHUV01042343.1.p3 GENE.GHUV01042343.1~~GHUV01042343.1.p3  ORF type:complete len:116 (-),score=14.90 GHUV01042343.1:845-1192(-)
MVLVVRCNHGPAARLCECTLQGQQLVRAAYETSFCRFCSQSLSTCVCRGRHFNSAARTHGPARTVDTLTVTEIYNLKNETDNRSLHAKLITGLYEKPTSLGVQVRLETSPGSEQS